MKLSNGVLTLSLCLLGSTVLSTHARATSSNDGWDSQTSMQFQELQEEENARMPSVLPDQVGKFRNTFYYLIWETDYEQKDRTEPVLDPKGNILALVSRTFRKDLLMEGSGKLEDGRVLNYNSIVDGVRRFDATEHSWGRGTGNCPLRPFKTIAADPSLLPMGATVYIDETKGMKLPDGSIHNGVWYAQDTGGAIKKDRIDIFVGRQNHGKLLAKAGIVHLEALTVRILTPPGADTCAHHSPR